MLATCFFYILAFVGISLFLCLLGAAAVYLIQGPDMAEKFIEHWIFNFNGLFVGGTGYGLFFFIIRKGRNTLNILANIIMIDESNQPRVLALFTSTSVWFRIALYSLPLTALGGFVLWKCRYPLWGFAKYYLAICSISMYFVATFILIYFLMQIWFFMHFETLSPNMEYNENSSQLELESINSFFIITSTLGILAIYFGFRGTLTAGFDFPVVFFKKALILPIIIYLPTALMYSLYPRFVIKKIADQKVIKKVEELNKYKNSFLDSPDKSYKEKMEFEKILAEIKEKLYLETKRLPILSIKDAPSLFLSLLVFIQFVLQKDNIISDFFNFF